MGKGGAKRHRKVLRDNIQGITKPAIRRLARRGGVKRISGLIYETFNIDYFEEYHNIYLKTDVVLLADIFQRFREVGYSDYGLDPLNYVLVPGLAWDAMLKMTGMRLELITDPKILNMLERHERGGLCFVGSKRHAKANNRELTDYDDSKPSSYIQYYDVNNLRMVFSVLFAAQQRPAKPLGRGGSP